MTQVPPIQATNNPQGSTKLVFVAMALAIVAVVLYNASIAYVRKQVDQAQFKVFKLAQPVRVGERLQKKYLKPIMVPKTSEFMDAMKQLKVIDETTILTRLNSKEWKLKRSANEGQLVTHDLYDEKDDLLGSRIREGYCEVSLPVTGKSVGALRRGVLVDINAPLHRGGTIAESVLVMERVKVVGLGLQSLREDTSGNSQMRSFSTITVEVKPDVARSLSNLQRLMGGEFEFELHLRNPTDESDRKTRADEIHPDVMKHLRENLGSTRSSKTTRKPN